MKKFLGLALLATVFTTSAFASVARLEALGEDQYGSQYVNDNRNMFLNASAINDHFDFATFEWGDTSKYKNEEATPKAQGGVFRKSGDMVYGVYFGADSNTASDLRAGGFGTLVPGGTLTVNQAKQFAGTVQNENTLDLFIGGETSWKWGARISKAGAEDNQGNAVYTKMKKTGLLVGFGAEKGMNSFYANVGAGNEYEVEATSLAAVGGKYHFEGKVGYQLGYVRALENNAKAFVEYQAQDAEETEITALDETLKVMKIKLGWAKTSKLNDTFTAFYKALYSTEKQENRGFVSSSEDLEESYLKATLGFEVMLKEWLHVRASIANNILGETTLVAGSTSTSKEKRTISDSTSIKLGATLAFGDFGIDGLIGNDANGNGTTGDENGQIRTDSLMSRVSMTYKF
jgi:hypothetical protein